MAKNKNNIPIQRFPQFTQGKGWDYVNANELFAPIVNKNHNSDLPVLAITQDQGAVPREMIDYNVIVSEKSIAGYKVVEIGDFIISLRSFQGGIEYSNFEGLCSPAYIVLRKKNDTICNDFYRHYFKSWPFIQDLNRNLEGIRDGKMVSYQQFSEILIPYPPFAEQQKIADCLSSIDSYTLCIDEKVEQLKTHKKSLMQKLFPQKGQTAPEFRFSEFKKDGSWEEKELGELIVEIAEFTSRGNNVPLYSLTIEDGVSPKTDRYERNFLVKKEGDNFKVVHPDDFVSNPMNLRFGAIGYNKESFKVCVSGYYDVFRFKDKGTSSFWINYMKSNWALDMYDRIAIGSLYEKRRVHFSNLLRMKLLVPKYSERLKISEYLSSMEEVIGFYSEKASLLEQHKKGLMQQLFPKA